MSRILALLLVANCGMFLWNSWDAAATQAQRPPEVNADGVEYLRVNINPTPIPPMVNINPAGLIPGVEVTRIPPVQISSMPEITIPPAACENSGNFETAVGQSVSGPIQLSYLNLPEPAVLTFVDNANNSFRVTLGPNPQLGTAINLRAGQRLEFGASVMYSGCRL